MRRSLTGSRAAVATLTASGFKATAGAAGSRAIAESGHGVALHPAVAGRVGIDAGDVTSRTVASRTPFTSKLQIQRLDDGLAGRVSAAAAPISFSFRRRIGA